MQRGSDGVALAKAGAVAAALWIVGMASRTGFEYWAAHGGSTTVAQFSRDNLITGSAAWTVTKPLTCMAFCLSVAGFGLALGVLQPGSVSVLPPSAAVLTAFLVLRRRQAALLGGALVAGLIAAAVAGADGGVANLAGQLLFCVVLALMAISMRQAGDNEERAELLLAQLEDAREAEAEAAAPAERTRIAQDPHDVLAQTLSGLAVHRYRPRGGWPGAIRPATICGGCSTGPAHSSRRGWATHAGPVSALRGERTPSLERLTELVERYRVDLELDVRLSVVGAPRALPADADLTLYRGAQEALTNAARSARGARTTVTLRYEPNATVLTIEDRWPAPGPVPSPLVVGSGLGLTGMRERLREVGGSADAGPTQDGWKVRMEVPA
ncbi:two-component sensor histidine kinase [Streptomyces antimycoticus]|uniref:sensor histidine kinase n=1 Tax=Streptomyces antimycoticus TaxID=68175 RepID=UPI003440CF6F